MDAIIGDHHDDQGPLLPPLIKKCVENKIKIICFKIGCKFSQSFEKIKVIYNKHKKTVENEGHLIDIYDFKRGNTEEFSSHLKSLLLKLLPLLLLNHYNIEVTKLNIYLDNNLN